MLAVAAGFKLPDGEGAAGVEAIFAEEGEVIEEDAIEEDLDEGPTAGDEGPEHAEIDTDGEVFAGRHVEGWDGDRTATTGREVLGEDEQGDAADPLAGAIAEQEAGVEIEDDRASPSRGFRAAEIEADEGDGGVGGEVDLEGRRRVEDGFLAECGKRQQGHGGGFSPDRHGSP